MRPASRGPLCPQVRAPMGGVREWLGALAKAGVPCAVSSSIDRLTLLAALDRMKLFHFFRVSHQTLYTSRSCPRLERLVATTRPTACRFLG